MATGSESALCISCRRPNPQRHCGLCEAAVCKGCVQELPGESFLLLPEIPAELSHLYYCPTCYDQHVAPELEKYADTVTRAQEVFVFFTTQRAPIPGLRKSKEVFRVKDITDRDEAILRLAFLAARQDFNAIVDVEIVAEKVRTGAYQTMKWSAQGSPGLVDAEKMERR